jgi:hypothetical protein
MKEIETEDEFHAAIEECLAEMPAIYARHPDKRAILEEIELELDIMRRRSAGGQVPTEAERDRIKIQSETKHHFPPNSLPMATYFFMQRLCDIAYCYRNWEEVRPSRDEASPGMSR